VEPLGLGDLDNEAYPAVISEWKFDGCHDG
jgi:hypothetical protein